jgi:hypothetical protein
MNTSSTADLRPYICNVIATVCPQDADLPIPMGLGTPSHITLGRTFVPVLLPDSVIAEIKRLHAYHLLSDHVDPTFLRILPMEHLQRIKSCWRVGDVRQLYSPRGNATRKLSDGTVNTISPSSTGGASSRAVPMQNPMSEPDSALSSSLSLSARITSRLGFAFAFVNMEEQQPETNASDVSLSGIGGIIHCVVPMCSYVSG